MYVRQPPAVSTTGASDVLRGVMCNRIASGTVSTCRSRSTGDAYCSHNSSS
jgi:hypothetical protein